MEKCAHALLLPESGDGAMMEMLLEARLEARLASKGEERGQMGRAWRAGRAGRKLWQRRREVSGVQWSME